MRIPMSSTRSFLYSAFIIVINTVILLLILNFVFVWKSPDLMRDGVFPRAFLNDIDRCYHTFYPATYDAEFQDWTAVVGDSYGAGAGDEFHSGSHEYGAFTKLKAKTGQNYLVFARGGYAAISSVRELVTCQKLFSGSVIFPNIGNPEKILFLFYEGNDLNGNVRNAQATRREGESVEDFVNREASTLEGDRVLKHYFPIFDLLNRQIKSLPVILGLRKESGSPDPSEDDVYNKIVVAGEERRIPDPQSAAVELADNLQDPLEIFYASISALRREFPGIPVDLVYIPSVVTCYQWSGDIRIQSYHTDDVLITNAEVNEATSRRIREALATFARGNDMGFVDTTDALKAAAVNQIIHGPTDWAHFNAVGYGIVADAIQAAGD